MAIPTPLQFVKYLLSEAKSRGGPGKINLHFRPQHYLCPFCELDFDIIAKVETYQRDTKMIIGNLKLEVLVFK